MSLLVAVGVALATPVAAHALPDTTINFEGGLAGALAQGTVVTDQYRSQGIYFLEGGFPEAGFPAGTPPVGPGTDRSRLCGRPPHIEVTTFSRTLGPGQCKGGGSVEFPDNAEDILGVFTTYRNKVSLKIGPKTAVPYTPAGGGFAEIRAKWDATMIAYDVNHAEVGRQEIHLNEQSSIPAGPNYTLSVNRPTGVNDIAFVFVYGSHPTAVESTSGPKFNYLVDDITFDNPSTPPAPTVLLGQTPDEMRVRGGSTATRKFSLLRFNDASGLVSFSIEDLPGGVTATSFTPTPTSGTTSTLSVTAGFVGFPHGETVTVRASGQGFPDRTTRFPLRLVQNFRLRAQESVSAPACRSVDLGVFLDIEPGVEDPITVSAQVLTGGRTLRTEVANPTQYPGFGVRPSVSVFAPVDDKFAQARVLVTAEGAGETQQKEVVVERPKMTVDGIAADPTAPQELRDGTMTIIGRGFCPGGVSVKIGDLNLGIRSVDLGFAGGPDSIVVEIPRDVPRGDIVVKSGGEKATIADPNFKTWRNVHGFQFQNYKGFFVDYGLMRDVFGDQVSVSVNPCSTLSLGLVSCGIATPLPSPAALLWIAGLNAAYSFGLDDAHCFGMSLTAVQMRRSAPSPAAFEAGKFRPFELASTAGPTGNLFDYIRRNHLRQMSVEVAKLAYEADNTAQGFRDAVRNELARKGPSPISIRLGNKAGHSMVVYDITDRPGGGADLHVYDPNRPAHSDRNDQPPITIFPNGTWEYPAPGLGWRGDMTKIFLTPADAVPARPTFISSLRDIIAIVSGSSGDATDETGKRVTPKTLPFLDPNVDNGIVAFPKGHTYTFEAKPKPGQKSYDFLAQGNGVVARLTGVGGGSGASSAAAKPDLITFDGRRGAVSVEPARGTAPLDATLVAKAGSSFRTAHVTMGSDSGSKIAFDRSRNVVQIRQEGPATTVRLELSETGKSSAPEAFRGAPVRIAKGQTLEFKPASWRNLTRVGVRVAAGPGKGRRRSLRDTSRPSGRVALGRVKVENAKGGEATITLPLRFGKLPKGTTATALILVAKGRKVVARKAAQFDIAPGGKAQTVVLAARGLKAGTYRVLSSAVVITRNGAGVLDSRSFKRRAAFTERR